MRSTLMQLVSYGAQDRYLMATCEYCKKYRKSHKILCKYDTDKIYNECLFHTIISNNIKQFMKHIDIYAIYSESVVNDIFKFDEFKNTMSEYNRILFDVSIDEQHIELYNRMLQFYRNFILIFTGEDMGEQTCNYSNDHTYCYLDYYKNENYEKLVIYGYSIHKIMYIEKLKI